MAHALCSVCAGEINTESSPGGKCVRCLAVDEPTEAQSPGDEGSDEGSEDEPTVTEPF